MKETQKTYSNAMFRSCLDAKPTAKKWASDNWGHLNTDRVSDNYQELFIFKCKNDSVVTLGGKSLNFKNTEIWVKW